MHRKTEFRVGEFVNYSRPIAGSPHFGAGRIIRAMSITGGQLLTMELDSHGWYLELDTSDIEHCVFRPGDVTSGVVITPNGIACAAEDQRHF
jgi:hypothetical protein